MQAKNGLEVQVIARRYANQPSLEVNGGVTIHRVGSPFTVNALLTLSRLTKEHAPTVIHTHSTSGAFLTATKRAIKAPIVSHVHGTTYSAAMPVVLSFGKMRNEYSHWRVTTSFLRERALWSTADRIAAVSTSVRSDLISRYGIREEKIRLVYNGVDANAFRRIPDPDFPQKRELEGKRVALYVGHFGLRKGIPFLIRAMKKVTREVRDTVLVCIGGVPPWLPKATYWSYLKELIAENGVEGNVVLLDRVPNEKLPDYYSRASVLVLPSYYEAFPKVLIEAMACETPVITSRLGGTIDSVDEGVNGLLVPYADPDALAESMIILLQDEKLARRMGSRGRERVLRDFTWQAVASRIQTIYDEVLTR